MQASHATVTHGPLVQIVGTLPTTAPAMLARAGAFEQDGAWWCQPEQWARVETMLRVLGVPVRAVGEPLVAPAPVAPSRPREAAVSISAGQIRVQGDLLKPMRKEWLGSERSDGHVGMSPWAFPEFVAACEREGVRVSLEPEAQALLADVRQRISDVEQALTTTSLPDVPLVTGSLRHYQRRSVAFGKAARGAFFIADEVGAGKTLQGIAWKRYAQAQRIAVICPSIAKGNWADEVNRFDGSRAVILDGFANATQRLPATGWAITSYDTLADRAGGMQGWLKPLIAWKPDLVIADESHYAKGKDSARGNALRALGRACRYRTPMSGTPMSNASMDLWSQLDFVQPGWWGTWFEFGLAFCDGKRRETKTKQWWDMSGVSNQDVLARRLRYIMLRRPKSEILPELPPQTRIPYRMDLLPGHRTEYNGVLKEYKDLIAKLRDSADDDDEAEALINEARGKRMGYLLKLRQISGLGRVDGTVELVADLVEQGKRPVVFAYFIPSLHALRDGLVKVGLRVGYIDGSIPRPVRDALRDSFNTGKLDVLLGQTEAMGVAINLQGASDTTVTHELTHKPLDVIQTEGRVFRSGQVNPTQHYYCLGSDTRDQQILDILLKKMVNIDSVMAGASVDDEVLESVEAAFFRVSQ